MNTTLVIFFTLVCPALLIWFYPDPLTMDCARFIIYKSMIFGLGVILLRETATRYRPAGIREKFFKQSTLPRRIQISVSGALYTAAILLSLLYCASSFYDVLILYTDP